MMDYLKAHPGVTLNQYMWELSVPFIKITSYDTTHVLYLSEKQAEARKAKKCGNGDYEAISDLGIPIFGLNNDK
jgi:hypothetical protein